MSWAALALDMAHVEQIMPVDLIDRTTGGFDQLLVSDEAMAQAKLDVQVGLVSCMASYLATAGGLTAMLDAIALEAELTPYVQQALAHAIRARHFTQEYYVPGDRPDMEAQNSWAMMRELVKSICASAPYVLGYESTAEPVLCTVSSKITDAYL